MHKMGKNNEKCEKRCQGVFQSNFRRQSKTSSIDHAQTIHYKNNYNYVQIFVCIVCIDEACASILD